jgi:hypothetical protein
MKLRADAKDWTTLSRAAFEWLARLVDQVNKHDDALMDLDTVGTYLESVVAAGSVALATNVAKDVATLQLPQGDWDVHSLINLSNGAVTGTDLLASLSLSSGGIDVPYVTELPVVPSASANIWLPIVPRRVLVTKALAPLTVHAVARCTFTGGAPLAGAFIRARLNGVI